MVDFKKHLNNPKRLDPLFSGELVAWVNKDGAPASEAKERTCKWELGIYHTSKFGDWVSFRITEGGVTGYESFILKDDRGIQNHMIEWVFGDRKYWCANAGGGGWPVMRVTTDQLRPIISQWMATQDEILSLCMTCGKIYDRKSAEGSTGGVSHGYCDNCMKE